MSYLWLTLVTSLANFKKQTRFLQPQTVALVHVLAKVIVNEGARDWEWDTGLAGGLCQRVVASCERIEEEKKVGSRSPAVCVLCPASQFGALHGYCKLQDGTQVRGDWCRVAGICHFQSWFATFLLLLFLTPHRSFFFLFSSLFLSSVILNFQFYIYTFAVLTLSNKPISQNGLLCRYVFHSSCLKPRRSGAHALSFLSLSRRSGFVNVIHPSSSLNFAGWARDVYTSWQDHHYSVMAFRAPSWAGLLEHVLVSRSRHPPSPTAIVTRHFLLLSQKTSTRRCKIALSQEPGHVDLTPWSIACLWRISLNTTCRTSSHQGSLLVTITTSTAGPRLPRQHWNDQSCALLCCQSTAAVLTMYIYRWFQEGCQPLQDPLRSVPHPWGWRRQQDRPRSPRSLRPQDRLRRRLRLHRCQQAEGHHLGREHSLRVPREPQEVHSRYQDGLRWSQEGQGQERHHHVCFYSATPQPNRTSQDQHNWLIFFPHYSFMKEATA